MKDKKILYGVCGIGMGHTHRQLPLLDALSRDNRIVLFAYGESLRFYKEHFAGSERVTIVPVAVAFYAGNAEGLDFAETARRIKASGIDYQAINLAAMEAAQKLIGKPDLVISDYEPVSAQYAYACGAPLVTIDQQSKYLAADFSRVLRGQTCLDEVARLRLFFPQAAARIACSFFAVPQDGKAEAEKVLFYPPIIKPEIVRLKELRDKGRGNGGDSQSVLVYISSQREFVQDMDEVMAVLSQAPQYCFHLFVKELPAQLSLSAPANVKLYRHGDRRFPDVLGECRGLITTAGHSLLSEAMYLGIPAYLIPLAVYEQQMNAHVVAENGFGICAEALTAPLLGQFLAGLPACAEAIASDKTVLVRGSGEGPILEFLRSRYLGD